MAVITISRQFGAGGKTLGERLAKRLGYRLVDQDMLDQAVEKAKASPEGILSFEMYSGSKLMKFLDSLISRKYIDRLLLGKRGYVDKRRYVEVIREIILGLHQEGNVIIIGRGGQYILSEYPDVCHILLVADREYREHFLMKEYKVSEKVAQQAIVREDRQRVLFLDCFAATDHDDPLLYHLLINTRRVSLDLAEELVIKLVSQ